MSILLLTGESATPIASSNSVTLFPGKTGSSENKISSFVSDLVPGFVSNNHQGFIEFSKAYFEWVEQNQNAVHTTINFADVMDVDLTIDSFVQYFKKMYLVDFQDKFVTNLDGNTVNTKTIIKNINDYFTSKGTENAYKFLLRVLHDTDVEFYYPKKDILRLSDGKWIQDKSIKITSTNGLDNFKMANNRVQQIDRVGANTAYAQVDSVLQYQYNQYIVTELFLSNINGIFVQGSKIVVALSDGTQLTELIYSVPIVVQINNPGASYAIGDEAVLDVTTTSYISGVGAKASVSSVSLDGQIKSVVIDNFGVNYKSSVDDALPVTFRSSSGDGTAQGTARFNALCEYPGYWANNDGRLSSNKYIRDGNFYQDNSYVVKAEIALDKYKKQAKKLIHPAGMQLFGNISLFTELGLTNAYHTEAKTYLTPLVAHYTPYTTGTTQNLPTLYTVGFNPGSTATGHCLGITGGKLHLSVGTGGGSYTLGSFANGQSITGASSGATGTVFGWSRSSSTGGVLYLYSAGTGGALGFQDNETIQGPSGITATATLVTKGLGTVYEAGGITHNPLDGALSAGASAHGSTAYWEVHTSFQEVDSTNNGSKYLYAFTNTSPYTAGVDYMAGNVVYLMSEESENTDDAVASAIVKEWIPGASGSTGGVLKLEYIGGGSLGAGTYLEINNRDGITFSYVFYDDVTATSGGTAPQTVGMLFLKNTIVGSITRQFHSDSGYTGF